jgi:enterochelin esterase-like enzyme
MESNRQFHTYLDEIGYPHEYLELPGGHTWEYWDANLPRALRQHMAVFSVPVG